MNLEATKLWRNYELPLPICVCVAVNKCQWNSALHGCGSVTEITEYMKATVSAFVSSILEDTLARLNLRFVKCEDATMAVYLSNRTETGWNVVKHCGFVDLLIGQSDMLDAWCGGDIHMIVQIVPEGQTSKSMEKALLAQMGAALHYRRLWKWANKSFHTSFLNSLSLAFCSTDGSHWRFGKVEMKEEGVHFGYTTEVVNFDLVRHMEFKCDDEEAEKEVKRRFSQLLQESFQAEYFMNSKPGNCTSENILVEGQACIGVRVNQFFIDVP